MKYIIGKILFCCSLLGMMFILNGCSNPICIVGSDNIVSESREVTEFDSVSLAGFGTVHVTQGETNSLEIKTSDNILPLIQTTVKAKELKIKQKTIAKRICGSVAIDIYVTMKDIKELEINGAGIIVGDTVVTGEDLEIETSGSSKVTMELDIQGLHVDTSGSSKIVLSGKATRQELDTSGSSKIYNFDLATEETKIETSGSADIEVTVSKNLDIEVSGSAKIKYKGNPKITQESSGSAKVTRVEE